jgi:hypothetical protein
VAEIHDREPMLWLRDQDTWKEIIAEQQAA